MNAIKTLIWIEWKKSSSKLNIMLGALALGIVGILVQSNSDGLQSNLMILTFLYLVGLLVIAFLSFQISNDFRSNQFHPLVLSPVSGLTQLTVKTLFLLSIAVVYHFILSALTYLVINPHLTGDTSGLAGMTFGINFYFVWMLILPSIVIMLLIATVTAALSRSPRGRKSIVFLLSLALFIGGFNLQRISNQIAGSYFPPMTLQMVDAKFKFSGGEEEGFNSSFSFQQSYDWYIDGKTGHSSSLKQNKGQSGGISIQPSQPSPTQSGINFPLDNKISIPLEQFFLVLLASLLTLYLCSRIWEELEL
jgi:hypothetical protein